MALLLLMNVMLIHYQTSDSRISTLIKLKGRMNTNLFTSNSISEPILTAHDLKFILYLDTKVSVENIKFEKNYKYVMLSSIREEEHNCIF